MRNLSRAGRRGFFRRLRPELFLAAVCAAGLVFAGRAALTVDKLKVRGTVAVSEREIIKRAGMPPGGGKFFLLPGVAERAVKKDPWIKSVSVKRDFRGGAVITVSEKKPFCLSVSADGGLRYLDSDGSDLGPAPVADRGTDYPVVRAPEGFAREGTRALEISASSRSAPRWDDISEVVVLGGDGFEIFTRRGMKVDLPGGDIAAHWEKLEKISRNLYENGIRATYINLRREGVGFVRPGGN